jgi:hypothetical protein
MPAPTSPYLTLVRAFEAEVTLTTTAGKDGPATAFRIAAPSRRLVEDELAALLQRVTERRARWMAIGPIWWEPDFVVFGEIEEAASPVGAGDRGDASHGLDVAR